MNYPYTLHYDGVCVSSHTSMQSTLDSAFVLRDRDGMPVERLSIKDNRPNVAFVWHSVVYDCAICGIVCTLI